MLEVIFKRRGDVMSDKYAKEIAKELKLIRRELEKTNRTQGGE